MPAETADLDVSLTVGPKEVQLIARGHIPSGMDDKWFIYHEDDGVWFHRSWTGICIYRVTLQPTKAGGGIITAAVANRNPEQYKSTDEAYDKLLLLYLIEHLLLGRDVSFPVPKSVSSTAGVYQHHVVGSANREMIVDTRDEQHRKS